MELFKQACWLHCQTTIIQYLLSNTHGRENGTAKAIHHAELCRFYVAVVKNVSDVELVRHSFEDEYQAVHLKTQELTDYLDEVIGFPLDSSPDYEALAPLFFINFHQLALDALNITNHE